MNKTVRLVHFQNTYAFTRPGSMIFKLGETLVYVVMS